jgi:1,4-dihydroxy-2-naphthoate octaprenyltransferase
MNGRKALLGPVRLPFLVLPPACVLLGVGTAVWTQGSINVLYIVLAFVGAVAAHISVNALNEYLDFRSGLDLRTERTPFSGGSGTLPASPEMARPALTIGLVALAVTALIGLYFLTVWGWVLLPLGLLGLVVVAAYTPWLTRSPLLCLIAPGVGFGLLMVMGTDFVLTGSYTWTAFVASLVPTFLVYGALLLLAYLSIIVGVVLGLLPVASLLGLLTLIIAVPTAINVNRHAENVEKLVPQMGLNVLLTVVTPVLVAIGLLVAP